MVGSNRSLVFIMAVLLISMLFVVSSTSDMSIITYDDNQAGESQWRADGEVMAMYESWLAKYGKSYNAIGEKTKRFQIFKENLKFVDEHNSVERGYEVGLNRFADLTNEEYRSTYLGLRNGTRTKVSSPKKSDRYAAVAGEELPESIDWREKGAVVSVKDQGSCGSCWAFSTIGAVEGINQIVTGNLISLSEQELVDCDTSFNEGCNGGLMDYAFKFIIKNEGIDSEKDYPYIGRDGQCDQNKKNSNVVSIDDFEEVPEDDEKSLQKAVAHQPVSVAIEAGGMAFQLYESGIFTGSCSIDLDHGVVAVGYGSEGGKDYWIVKNSYGKSWGESGYIRMERNIADSTGKCGIAMAASYPIKKGQNPPNPGLTLPSSVTPYPVKTGYSGRWRRKSGR